MPSGTPSKRAQIWSNISSSRRQAMRLVLIERDGTKCFHCGKQTRLPTGININDLEEMTIDHFPVPKRELPVQEWLNPSRAVIACLECNRRLDNQTQAKDRRIEGED